MDITFNISEKIYNRNNFLAIPFIVVRIWFYL